MTGAAEVLALARELLLPEQVLGPLERAVKGLPEFQVRDLAAPDTAGEAWKKFAGMVPDWVQDDGMAHLAATLSAAVYTRRNYEKRGIADEIFRSTMGCVRRFLEETHAIFGRWAYDRGFWTWRQTGCLLYRLGALEYEYCAPGMGECRPEHLRGVPVLNVHIPSDAALGREDLDRSYDQADCFFAALAADICGQGRPQAMLCGSWLLSPALDQLLPEGSSIRRFAADYVRYREDAYDTEFYRWLFGSVVPLPAEDLPERTSLQRRAKSWLLADGKIGMACGQYMRQRNAGI